MSAIIWMKISLFLFLPIHSLLSCKMPWISRLSLRGSDCRIIEECLNQPIHGVTGRNQSSNVLFNKVKFNFTPKKFQISPCIELQSVSHSLLLVAPGKTVAATSGVFSRSSGFKRRVQQIPLSPVPTPGVISSIVLLKVFQD